MARAQRALTESVETNDGAVAEYHVAVGPQWTRSVGQAGTEYAFGVRLAGNFHQRWSAGDYYTVIGLNSGAEAWARHGVVRPDIRRSPGIGGENENGYQ